MRARMPSMAVSARGVQRSRSSSVRPSCPGRTGNRSASAARAAPWVDSERARSASAVSAGTERDFRTADLVATGRAAVDLPERGVRVTVPDELVDDDGSAAGRALRGEELVERLAEADLAARLGAEGVDRGIEVAQVRRAEDDLGRQARERRRLMDVGAAQSRDRGPRDPAATTVEVDDDIAWVRARLDLGDHEVQRWRWREAVERRAGSGRDRAG